jgi:hypothetical protein
MIDYEEVVMQKMSCLMRGVDTGGVRLSPEARLAFWVKSHYQPCHDTVGTPKSALASGRSLSD